MTFINTYTTKLAGVFYARSKFLLAAAGILLLPLLIACALDEDLIGDDTYTIGGAVTGHTGEVSLTLTYGDDNKIETLKVFQGGKNFAFEAKLATNQEFTIAITAPQGQTCSSSLTSGTIVDRNITNIEITCSVADTYSVSGTVNGAADNSQITITLSHGDAGTPPANIISENVAPDTTDGTFSFDVPENRVYLITVASDTTREVCTTAATAYSDPVTANITGADITCSIAAANTYSIGGSVSGLANAETITLTLSPTGGVSETEVITGDADATTDDTFAFDTALAAGDTYTVTTTSPTGKTCTVNNAGTQTMGAANANITVTCVVAAANTYSIGGSVSGLANAETITLTLSPTGGVSETEVITGDADATTDDTFAFDTRLAAGDTYTVTTTSPTGKTCTVNNAGTQTMGAANANITVTCVVAAANTYSIGGSVSGLANAQTITLTLSPTGGVSETEVITGDADATTDDTFAFDTRLAAGDTYTVTTTSPAGKTCTVNNAGTQTMGAANANITVTCVVAAAANTYSISGTVTRADATSTIYVVLTVADDNAGTGATSQSITVNATDGTFSFASVAENKFYTLKASSSIVGEACTSSVIAPVQITANVTGTQVTCTAPAAGSLFVRISLYSGNYLASLTTVNVFVGNGAIPATTGTATKVINGSDADVVLIDLGGNGEQYYYDISINTGQYYAVTVTTTSDIGTEVCRVMSMSGGSAGPVAANATETVFCDQQWW